MRLATPGDAPLLGFLRQQAFVDLQEVRGGAMYVERQAVGSPQLVSDWSNSPRRVWLGGLAQVELGYLLAAVVSIPSGAKLGVVEGIYVEPAGRGCGVGGAMLGIALEWFGRLGCVGVEAVALPGQRDTKNFFEENGLTARMLTVYRSFASEG